MTPLDLLLDPGAALAAAQQRLCDPDGGGQPGFRRCTVSVLDTRDDPAMWFDEQGRCQYYHVYQTAAQALPHGEAARMRLEQMVATLKEAGRGKPYDCLLGVSGGVDSTYLALLAHELGLRPLLVHFDNGWNSELAVQNVRQIVETLGFDLYTYVINWEEFRDLQLAYLRASVVDIEALSDHAILATMYRIAEQKKLRYVISGTNIATEAILPASWIHNKHDAINIRAIHRRYGTTPLKTFPFVDRWDKLRHLTRASLVRFDPLNWVDYRKDEVKQRIVAELGWRDYGGKHYESVWTRFYQGYILPVKFGIDKRKAHLSNLIFSGQMTRAQAFAELEAPIYPGDLLRQDYTFVLKKLGLTPEAFAEMMATPPRAHAEFAVERPLAEEFAFLRPIGRLARRLRVVPART